MADTRRSAGRARWRARARSAASDRHWSGWEFEAYPRVTRIEFQNAARTRAAVSVTVGYSGTTIVVTREQDVWRAIEMVGLWVT
jgi:hypothetical protein